MSSDNNIHRSEWLLLVDADDTLWYDSRYFRELEMALISCAIKDGILEEDLKRVYKKALGQEALGEHRFVKAIRETLKTFNFSNYSRTEIEKGIDIFISHPIDNLPDAAKALKGLKNFRKILLTKGDEEEQRMKLVRSGLESLFDKVIILRQKTSAEFSRVLSNINIPKSRIIVIGNSIKHDIKPATQNRLHAIWLNHSDNRRGQNAPLPDGVQEVKRWRDVSKAIKNIIEG